MRIDLPAVFALDDVEKRFVGLVYVPVALAPPDQSFC